MGLLVVLALVAAPTISNYAVSQELKQADNSARTVYMAAQGQATLLKQEGHLEGLLKELPTVDSLYPPTMGPWWWNFPEGLDKNAVYVLSNQLNSAPLNELLPVGSIDQSLRNGSFALVYSPQGNLIDVLFSNSSSTLDTTDKMRKYYRYIKVKEEVVWDPEHKFIIETLPGRSKSFIGYYGVRAQDASAPEYEPAENVNVVPTIDAPVISLESTDRLLVTVTYVNPTGSSLIVSPIVAGLQNNPWLYGDEQLKAAVPLATITKADLGGSPNLSTITYDLLTAQFSDFGSFTFGVHIEGVVIPAGLSYPVAINPVDTSVECNGNFQKIVDSDGAITVTVSSARHLRNLHKLASNTDLRAKVTTIIQAGNIDASVKPQGTSMVPKFQPLNLPNVKLFNGNGYSISGLYMQVPQNVTAVGLFQSLGKGATASNPAVIKNVFLDNPRILSGAENQPAAALVGTAEGPVTFTNVHIQRAAVQAYGAGAYAGTFVGQANAHVQFTDCTAVNSSVRALDGTAGGFAGYTKNKASFNNCQTKWEPLVLSSTSDAAPGKAANAYLDMAKTLIGSVTNVNSAALVGYTVGGFIGKADATVDITNKSYTATSLDTAYPLPSTWTPHAVGGFVGEAALAVTGEDSWADCRLVKMKQAPLVGAGVFTNVNNSCSLDAVASGLPWFYGNWWKPYDGADIAKTLKMVFTGTGVTETAPGSGEYQVTLSAPSTGEDSSLIAVSFTTKEGQPADVPAGVLTPTITPDNPSATAIPCVSIEWVKDASGIVVGASLKISLTPQTNNGVYSIDVSFGIDTVEYTKAKLILTVENGVPVVAPGGGSGSGGGSVTP